MGHWLKTVCLPSAVRGGFGDPESNLVWVRAVDGAGAASRPFAHAHRQSYLRLVPGMKNAGSYARNLRSPVMRKNIEQLGRINWNHAQVQSKTLDWSNDLVQRCSTLTNPETIGNKVLAVLKSETENDVEIVENNFWFHLIQIDGIREQFFPMDGD